jgi:Domain of unknown function (DUF4281)
LATLLDPLGGRTTYVVGLGALNTHCSRAGRFGFEVPAMNETIFAVASLVAVTAWIGLAIAAAINFGRARTALLLVAGRVVPLGLCALYVILLAAHWGSAPGGGFSTLSAVLTLFAVPGKMLGGWVHFLAFDLFVGRWMVDDALSPARSRWPLWLGLPATFLYGPLGVLLYLAARHVAGRIRRRRAAR